MTTPTPALIEAKGLGKRFGPLVALKSADFALRAGRVGAIVGENGAGKSTLAKILAGVYRADEGGIFVDGKAVAFANRRRAAALGIGFVPQSLSFVGTLSVIDNHLLAGSAFALDRAAARRSLERTAARIGIDVLLDRPVETLSLSERQLAEIVSAVAHGARALLLDEPTSALGPIEVDRLIATLRLLSEGGTAIGLVTHRVREVLEGAQDVTVLRQGEVVFSGQAASLDAEAVSRLMVGARERGRPVRPKPGVGTRLAVEALGVGAHGRRLLEGISFTIRGGEILGVAGVAGPAQPALAEALAGLRGDIRGRVAIDGEDVTERPAEAMRLGLAYVPEDRALGLLPDQTVSVNASLLHMGESAFRRFGLRRPSAEAGLGRSVIERFDVRPPRGDLAAGRLSGGNQQKLLVGRELERKPSVIVAHGPTQGLDLAAASAIRAALVEAASDGAAVLVISADLDELLAISSRIIVLASGAVAASFDCADADADLEGFVHRIGLAMTGAGIEEAA
ncbi:ABC transporter ATP-binding protein [Methylocapsa sp. S129]|uniref:ABC transporter ATP-binding protein n=1 Tax=Methylocapsa sp. S129 TaxID=1641869 RepID=UPI00131C0EA8|nr:ATP-binding cassette domain-containing protein [Methylocapsa sp. S129]